ADDDVMRRSAWCVVSGAWACVIAVACHNSAQTTAGPSLPNNQSATPTLVSSVSIPANYGIHDSFIRDGLAFVCAWNTGVMIFDVGNGMVGGSPSNPKLISTYATTGGEVHNAWCFWS